MEILKDILVVIDYFFTNIFSGLATLATGGVAWYLYQKALADEFKTAAKTIILEIKEAEKVIKIFMEIKNSEGTYPADYFKVIPHNAWEKYAHLFIKKLNNDEYQQINDFYKKCEILEKYIDKNYNFFWITTEERARLKEKIGADYSMNIARQEESTQKGSTVSHMDKIENISKRYTENTAGYKPIGITAGIDKTLNSISLIINTPTWNKIKGIAEYDDILG